MCKFSLCVIMHTLIALCLEFKSTNFAFSPLLTLLVSEKTINKGISIDIAQFLGDGLYFAIKIQYGVNIVS